MLKRTAQRSIRMRSRILRSLSLMEMRERMSWQRKEQCWTTDSWRKREQRQSSKRERRSVWSLAVCGQLSLSGREIERICGAQAEAKDKWIFVDKKSEGTKHRTEWCAAVSMYQCTRCGRGTKYMRMLGTYMVNATFERTRCGKKNGQARRSIDLVHKKNRAVRDREWAKT